jgi:hypothetical protein
MLIIIAISQKAALRYEYFSKNNRVPSPRNPAIYKTNLTNRHENF